MLLAIDVGNTNIVLGLMDGREIRFTARFRTDRARTEDEYALLFRNLFDLHRVDRTAIEGSIISSVVSELGEVIRKAVEIVAHVRPMVVGAGVRTGLNIRASNAAELGSDIVVGAVAALERFPAPILIIDMGTATTLSVIGEGREFLGCVIVAGLRVSVDALASGTSQLPRVDLKAPARVLNTVTSECMNAGAIYGCAAMLDGLIARIEDELGRPLGSVVGTGGLMKLVAPACRRSIAVEEELMLEGLRVLYDKNRSR